MEWLDILKFSGTAAILTFLLNWGATVWKDHANLQKETRYSALRVALILENFAINCAEAIGSAASYNASEHRVGDAFYELPTLTLPEEVQWKTIELNFVNRVMAFPMEILNANRRIDFCHQDEMPDEPTSEPEEQAGLCGHRALVMAGELREFYKLKQREAFTHGWDYATILKKYHDKKIMIYAYNSSFDPSPGH